MIFIIPIQMQSLLYITIFMFTLFTIPYVNSQFNTGYVGGTLGPLNDITDWVGFKNDCIRLKANGHNFISTDLWVGKVWTSRSTLNWSYYQTMASNIKASGLMWVPIFSTHQSSAYNIPTWWAQPISQQYTSITGATGASGNDDVLTPWYSVGSDTTYSLYKTFYSSFVANFASTYGSIIIRLDVSGGPSGEIRYPSYSTDGWVYPQRGQLMTYNGAAITAFQNAMISKYGSLAGVNAAWGTTLTSSLQITPPCDTYNGVISSGPCAGTRSDTFFNTGVGTTYGKDFMGWYQQVLITHAGNIMTSLTSAMSGSSLAGKPIGIKVAGIHWLYFLNHDAEYCSGYYNTDNYAALINGLKGYGYQIAITADELNDHNAASDYSGGHSLPQAFYATCVSKGAKCNGENANSIGTGGESLYSNMRNIVYNGNVGSLAILRYNDITEDTTLLRYFSQYVSTMDTAKKVLWFQVFGFATNSGDTLKISGSISQLGSWSTGSTALSLVAVPNTCVGNVCQWTGSVVVPSGTGSFTWKLAKTTSTTSCFQNGANNGGSFGTRVNNFYINPGTFSPPGSNSDVTNTAISGVTLPC
jgi:beta-amylase